MLLKNYKNRIAGERIGQMLKNNKIISIFQNNEKAPFICHKSKSKHRKKVVLLAILGLLTGLLFFPSTGAAETFQKAPVTLKASEILPKGLLTGSNYKLKEAVKNDGFINTYVLETTYGSLTVETTARLLIRINGEDKRADMEVQANQLQLR